MRETLSIYKFKKIAEEALRNGIRLHIDSIILFSKDRIPSALQLSIIAMEEIAKAKSVEHYYFTSVTNVGFPDKEFEQKWLNDLYFHPKKQYKFIGREFYRYSPKFVEHVKSKNLEQQKQNVTYVGLKKKGRNVDVNSRISVPLSTNANEAKKMISIINDELKEMCQLRSEHEYYFWIPEMDYWIDDDLLDILYAWNFSSGIKSDKWEKVWDSKFFKNKKN
jgi:AbiV family abortive infection protein